MDDKTKVSLLYTLIGGLLGIVSAVLSVFRVPNSAILLLYIVAVYATTYLYPIVGVSLEKLGEKRPRSALNGVLPSILPWLVLWTMVFYMVSPVVILTNGDTEAAEGLARYLESQGMRVKISDDYQRYLSAQKVIIFGSRMPIPLGTTYGVTAFPDSIQRLVSLGKEKGNLTVEKVDSGELIIIRETGRSVIIISGQKGQIGRIAQENQEKIYNLLR